MRRLLALALLVGCEAPQSSPGTKTARRALPDTVVTTPLSAAPVIRDPVTDLAGLLEPAEEARLDRLVRAVRDETGVQVALLTVPGLPVGVPIEDFSLQVAEQWEGGGERDDGVLVTLAWSDRRSRVEVGYGLEGYVTDAEAGELLAGAGPFLRANDTAGALAHVVSGVHEEVASLRPGEGIPMWRRAYGASTKWMPSHGVTSLLAFIFGALTAPWLAWGFRKRGYPAKWRSRAARIRWPLRLAWLGFFGGLGSLLGLVGEEGALIGFVLSGLVASVVQLPIGFAPSSRDLRWGLGVAAVCLLGGVAAFVGLIFSEEMFPEFALVLYGPLTFGMVLGASLPGGGGGGGGSGSSASGGSSSSYSGGGGSSGGSSGGGDWGGGGGGFGGGGASGSW